MANKKIFQLAEITDEDLSNLALLWMVGDPDTGTLYKPTLQQLKDLILGNLVANGILLSDGNGIIQDATDFSWNPSTNALSVLGSATFGNSGNTVNVPTPVNLGYLRSITIDQPNMQILLRVGNGDNGAYIKRVAINSGEYRIGSGQTVDGSNNPLDGFITFYCNTAEVARLTKNGIIIPSLTTTQRNAITSPATGLLIFNTTAVEFQFYNGSSWASIGSGGGGGLTSVAVDGVTITGDGTVGDPLVAVGSGSIDESFQTVTYSATPTIDLSTKRNFLVNALTGNMAITFTGPVAGREYKFRFLQDATGGRTVTFPTGTKIPLGFGTGNVANITTTAGAEDWWTVIYTGSAYRAFPSGLNMV